MDILWITMLLKHIEQDYHKTIEYPHLIWHIAAAFVPVVLLILCNIRYILTKFLAKSFGTKHEALILPFLEERKHSRQLWPDYRLSVKYGDTIVSAFWMGEYYKNRIVSRTCAVWIYKNYVYVGDLKRGRKKDCIFEHDHIKESILYQINEEGTILSDMSFQFQTNQRQTK